MIYIFLFILLLLFSYHYDYRKKTAYKWSSFYFMLIAFIFVAGLRYRLGVDSIRYESYHKYIPDLFSLDISKMKEDNYDPLFYLMCSFSKTISDDFWMMQMLQALWVNSVVFWFIKKNTSHIFLALLFYFVFLYLNFMCEVMREACAVSFFLLSWNSYKQSHWVKYYFLIVIAFLFHSSAIVLFLLPFFKWLRLNKYLFILFPCLFLCGFYLQRTFFDYLQLFYISERIANKVEMYSMDNLSGQVYTIMGSIVTIILNVLYPCVALYFYKSQKKLSHSEYEPMVIMCAIFAIVSIPLAVFYRYNNYFMPFSIIVLSDFVYNKLHFVSTYVIKQHSYFLFFILLFPCFLLKVYGYFAPVGRGEYQEYMRYFPYSSIIEKSIDQQRERLFYYYNAW